MWQFTLQASFLAQGFILLIYQKLHNICSYVFKEEMLRCGCNCYALKISSKMYTPLPSPQPLFEEGNLSVSRSGTLKKMYILWLDSMPIKTSFFLIKGLKSKFFSLWLKLWVDIIFNNFLFSCAKVLANCVYLSGNILITDTQAH